MQVEVVGRTGDGLVTVKSAYGTFSGWWRGDDQPEPGSSHWVEVDIDDVVVWGDDIRLLDVPTFEVADDTGFVRVAGLVTDFDTNDVVVVDLNGSQLIIDTDGHPPLGVVGRHVAVRAHDVSLFPYDL